MIVERHKPGTFCWIELGSTGQAECKAFYSGLFGWGIEDYPMGPDDFYTMFKIDGKDVAALYQLNAGQLAQHIPSHWLAYIAVESADESAARILKAGGRVIAEPFDVMEVGRMALATDPAGAHFALWQPKSHIGVRIKDQANSLCWVELATTDVEGAMKFYGEAFGWKGVTKGDYTEFSVGESMVGGMMEIQKEWGPVPPNWMIYFMVDDCNASAEKVVALGGRIIRPPDDIPEVGRFALIEDPKGAMFSVIKLNFM